MASFVYTTSLGEVLKSLDFTTDDIRALAVMTNTTADTEEDTTTLSGFTTLDECDDTTYARHTFTSEAVTADTVNNRGEFDGEDITFTFAGDGSRQIAAMLIYKHITDDTDAIPIAYIDNGAFPFTGNGTVTISWNTEGIIQVQNAV